VTRLLLATRNEGKVRELRALLESEPIQTETLATHPEAGQVEETGKTFDENARLKARQAALSTGLWSLGEDSGLEVDTLNGEPGVRSARYAGVHGDDAANNARLLRELAGSKDRSARYVCVLALANPEGEIVASARGTCEGWIAKEPRGSGGFGYDPCVVPEQMECTMAELEPAAKDAISHRGSAIRTFIPLLRVHLCPQQESG